ncbi:MAG: hypothetical protein HC924_11915 [Synechococcaceae cyanobacterium SM2_3_2]|nr:hypothetical protein [Synechococcaceae cyanobacterium SM2_3_2]
MGEIYIRVYIRMNRDPAIGFVRWVALLLTLSACGAVPTTDTTLISPNLSVLSSSNSRTPTPALAAASSALLPSLPVDELALRIEKRGSDWVVLLPSPHVSRWLAHENGVGVEWIDVNLTVGSYRQTATAQLRADQGAVFTFSDVPSSGQAVFSGVAFRGADILAEGRTEIALSAPAEVATTAAADLLDSQSSDLLVLSQTQVPLLQGIQSSGAASPLSLTPAGRVAALLNPAQEWILLGRDLDQVTRILWIDAETRGSSGSPRQVSEQSQFLEQSPTVLRVRPPQGLGRSSLVMLADQDGLGLGTLALTWQPTGTPTPSPAAPSPSPTPSPSSQEWQIQPLEVEEDTNIGSWLDPYGMVAAADGSIYLADRQRHQILRRDPEGNLERVAGTGTAGFQDGEVAEAQFDQPTSLAWDLEGNLLVVDQGNHRIRRVKLDGQVETVAGSGQQGWRDGSKETAQFRSPEGITLDPEGNLYIADTGNHRIRMITPAGQVSTVAGGDQAGDADGPVRDSRLNQPTALAWDPVRQSLWISDTGNHQIRRLSAEGILSTVVGNGGGFADGSLERVMFDQPSTLATDPAGSLWIADRGNDRIRQLLPQNRVQSVSVVTPGSPTPVSRLEDLITFAPAPDGTWVVLTDSGLSRLSPK